jgi:hypothetical protein
VAASIFLLSQAGYLGFVIGGFLLLIGALMYALSESRQVLVEEREGLLLRTRRSAENHQAKYVLPVSLMRFLAFLLGVFIQYKD